MRASMRPFAVFATSVIAVASVASAAPACSGSSTASGAAPVDAGADAASDGTLSACADAASAGTGSPPKARGDVAGALDPGGTKMVIFGGDAAVVPCGSTTGAHEHEGDTAVIDLACGSWHVAAAGASAPEARARHAMAADPDRGRALLFGGRTRSGSSGAYTLFDDVWAFDFAGEAWSKVPTSGGKPPPRSNTAMVVSRHAAELVAFGGNSDTTGFAFEPLGDTWALDLTSGAWRAIATGGTRPPARLFHAMAIDDDAGVVYLFSGGDANAFTGPFLKDLWALDLGSETWRRLTPGGDAPRGRINHGMTFDAVSHRLLVFGGHDDGPVGNQNDVYALDVTVDPPSWSKLPGGDAFNKAGTSQCTFPPDFTIIDPRSPERRAAFAMGARPDGRGFAVFGGKSDCGLLDDVWWFSDGASPGWTSVRATPVGLSCLREQTSCSGLCG